MPVARPRIIRLPLRRSDAHHSRHCGIAAADPHHAALDRDLEDFGGFEQFSASDVTRSVPSTPSKSVAPRACYRAAIGRASSRARGCQYMLISVGAEALKKQYI